MWMMPLHINQKSDYDMMMMKLLETLDPNYVKNSDDIPEGKKLILERDKKSADNKINHEIQSLSTRSL